MPSANTGADKMQMWKLQGF